MIDKILHTHNLLTKSCCSHYCRRIFFNTISCINRILVLLVELQSCRHLAFDFLRVSYNVFQAKFGNFLFSIELLLYVFIQSNMWLRFLSVFNCAEQFFILFFQKTYSCSLSQQNRFVREMYVKSYQFCSSCFDRLQIFVRQAVLADNLVEISLINNIVQSKTLSTIQKEKQRIKIFIQSKLIILLSLTILQ